MKTYRVVIVGPAQKQWRICQKESTGTVPYDF